MTAVFGCALTFGRALSAEEPHWAFQPVTRVSVPSVNRTDLLESPIDAFILEKLEAAKLSLADPADKRTLIRRASYDLIGLPPTHAAVAEYVNDDSPDAFARLVDRLLASPHYGERWGRHWLDVARYANTKGDTGAADPVSPHAFTFRDYVVRAMNEDLSYDQFLIEQIAADQLAAGENSPSLAALGFITVGRRFLNNFHDTIDDRIDVVTRGTMALTVSCARCHDHKYDPIPTRDYYSLYGVFASCNEPDPAPIISQSDPSAFNEYRALREQAEANRSNIIRENEAQIVKQFRSLTADYLLDSRRRRGRGRTENNGAAFEDTNVRRAGARRWRKALEKLNAETDPVFAPWFAFAALPQTEFTERARELSARIAANQLAHPVNSRVAQAFAGEPPTSLKEVAQRYAQLIDDVAPDRLPPENGAPPPGDADRDALRIALFGEGAPGNLSENDLRQLFPPQVQMQIQKFASELDRLDAKHPGAPLRAMALFDNPQPQNARIFIRGNPNNPGDEAPRQFLELLAGPNRQPFTRGSGRLELAQAIVSRDNVLTARVIVNRLWLHHFGEGLVTTVDDFGVRSDPPSHPQLLDNLAAQCMDGGWSLKKLHRLLVLSRVYRQSSDDRMGSETADPEHRLLAKMNRRRLDFESMRDSLLVVAGNLDDTMKGRAVELTPQPLVAADGSFSGAPSELPPSARRAIYGFVDRQNLPGLWRSFDFADPDTINGRRFCTTVPQQALFFYNNPFVMQQACNVAARIESGQPDSVQKQVVFLYRHVLQRDPTALENELAIRFLTFEQSAATSTAETIAPGSSAADPKRPLRPFERLAHVLLMSDEFLFVD